jgi:hypothetical protein
MTTDNTSNSNEFTNVSTTRIIGDTNTISQYTNYSVQKITGKPNTNCLVNGGTFLTAPIYPRQVYLITNRVAFDILNGNLIIGNGWEPPSILNRSGNIATESDIRLTSVSSSTEFKPFISYIDSAGSWLLYMQGKDGSTLVVIFNSDMTIFNVVCFTKDGVWSQGSSLDKTDEQTMPQVNDVDINFYVKDGRRKRTGKRGYGVKQGTYEYWLAYWNSMSDSQNPTYSEDYLLKTQVVPPVCPTCPSCSTTGTCTNCGGTGGAGTLGTAGTGTGTGTGEGVSGVINNTVNTAGDIVNRATLAGTVLAGGAGLGAYNLASKTLDMTGSGVSGAVGLARDTVGGTVGLARDTVGGTVGLARETVGGTVGLARETVGGAVGLLKSAGTGVKDVLTQGPRQSQYGGQSIGNQSVGTQSQYGGQQSTGYQGTDTAVQSQYGMSGAARYNTAPGADPYSYYGALPSKGQSNYIPITADFSAFSK